MSEEKMKDLMEDPEDEVLKAVMGSKFRDMSNNTRHADDNGIAPQAFPSVTTPVCEPVRNDGADQKKIEANQAVSRSKVFDTKPRFYEKLRECGKWALIFGGLCLLVFYWQQTGQMLPSAAVPCMMACSFGAAWCVGRACK